jgi:outer membrane lipoprotein-sorting protein
MKTKKVVAIASAFLLACSGSFASSSPEAVEWMTKMGQAVSGAFKTKYSGSMNQSHMGMEMSLTLDGDLQQADPKHLRSRLTMNMKSVASAEGADLTMSALTVADGTNVWTEMDMFGGKQVMKHSLESLAGAAAGAAPLPQMRTSDPMSQLRQMSEHFDFAVKERADGRVTLSAKVTEEGLEALGHTFPEDAEQVLADMTIVIDEATGFPVSVSMGGATPVLAIEFDAFETVDPAAFSPGPFLYTPPEGVNVMDVGAMLEKAPEP